VNPRTVGSFGSPPPFSTQTEMTINRRHITFRSEKGQTMVEFAIALPILCLILFAVIQFGIVFNNYIALTDAARAGARKGAVSRQTSDPTGACVTAIQNSSGLDQSKLGATCSSSWQRASDVTATATYPYSISLLGFVVKSGTLTTTTTERVE
jgi:Flp pilus assembly protein TadG